MTKRCPKGKIAIDGKCVKDDKRKYGILKASGIKQPSGMLPHRIVLRKWHKDAFGNQEYVTHTQVWLPNGQTGFEMGHYFMDKEHAEQDYRIRKGQHERYG